MAENKKGPAGMTAGELRAWEVDRVRAGADMVSGNAVIGGGARGSRPDPLWAVEICRGAWPEAKPRTLQLGTLPAGLTPNSRSFPIGTDQRTPGASYESWQIGFLGGAGSEVFLGNGFPVACMLEYGQGAAGSRVMFDWTPGAYNLPPCSYANVSVLPWGPVFASNWGEVLFSAAVSPGNIHGAPVPLISASYALAENDYVVLPVPDHARGFEVVSTLSDGAYQPSGKLIVSGAAVGVRDFANNLYAPGWTPLDVVQVGGSQVTVRCVDDGGNPQLAFQLRWYLAL